MPILKLSWRAPPQGTEGEAKIGVYIELAGLIVSIELIIALGVIGSLYEVLLAEELSP
jgi:hypothetical protein